MIHSPALAFCACCSPPTASFLLASALVFKIALFVKLHSLDSVLGRVSSARYNSEQLGPGWVWSAEEVVLDLRIQGSLQHTHLLILLHFRNCQIPDMFVWGSYECHSISLPSRYQRQSKKIRNCLLIWWFNGIELLVVAQYINLQRALCVCIYYLILAEILLPSQKSHWIFFSQSK